ARRSAGRWLRIGDLVEADLPVAGDGDEALLLGMIAPELSVDGIRNDAGRDVVVLGRGEEAGFGGLARELGAFILRIALDELMDAAAGEVHKVDFALGVLAPTHDAIGGAGDLAMVRLDPYLENPVVFLVIVNVPLAMGPDAPGIEVAVDILAIEFFQSLS